MDGLLVIDKPSGPTSHDVVARMRRVLGEPRIGHTGTLDPLATGVLPLVVGRATRLARFLSGSDKAYDAVVRLGFATDSGDCQGSPVGLPYTGPMPTRTVIADALDAFRGQFLQTPPVFSAKKIGGQRSYELFRGRSRDGVDSVPTPSPLRPQKVTVARLSLLDLDGDRVSLTLDCSAGFYVRALAHDLGARLGTGGHLVALRRTRVGALTLDHAIPLADAERDPAATAARLVPMSRMLTDLPALTLDADAIVRTRQGRDLPGIAGAASGFVRLVDDAGDLVAIAEPSQGAAGFLHPSVVLR
ncbi:MAG TPA: tRNA pseudouridine(55) synthase TruB [Vicinamibacterales bacterium]|nr:tRNA pseudouridine(55) synthase TruB [Vicinamibacterales bacterium]